MRFKVKIMNREIIYINNIYNIINNIYIILKMLLFLTYVSVCSACIYICTLFVLGTTEEQNSVLETLELYYSFL